MRNTNAYENCLRIAVWHHPLHSSGEDRIKDTGFIELLAQSDFRLALHGHVHEAGIEQLRYDLSAIGRGVHLSAAGTFGALTALSPGVPLQYQVIEIEGKKAKVHTRRREKPGGAWKPDARWLVGDGRSASASYEIELF